MPSQEIAQAQPLEIKISIKTPLEKGDKTPTTIVQFLAPAQTAEDCL